MDILLLMCAKIAAFATAQCLLLETLGECAADKELEPEELEEIVLKLKESVLTDIRQVPVWNTLGIILLKTGRLEVHSFSFQIGYALKLLHFFTCHLICLLLNVSRVLFQFCLLCRPWPLTTWIALQILVLHICRGKEML